MTTCAGCFERFPQLEQSKLCGKCQRISDARDDAERQKAKMLETCENCGAAGLSITTPCPLCRGGDSQNATASISAASLLQKAEEHKAKASGLRVSRKAPPTTESVTKARADAKDLAKKERIMFQWTMYYKTVEQKNFADTSNLPEGKEFAVSTLVGDIIGHITKSVETAWSGSALAHLRSQYGPLDGNPIEFALVNPGGKGIGVKFYTDDIWNTPLKAVLPTLSDHFKWGKGDRIVHLRAFVRVRPDTEDIVEDVPKTRSTRKRKTRSVDSIEDAESLNPTSRRPGPSSTASSLSIFNAASFFSIFGTSGGGDRRSFKRIDIDFELEGGQYKEKIRSGGEMEVVELLNEPKGVGGFKGCFPAQYDGRKVAVCVAEGMENINYSEEDNEKFVISEARALSFGRCLAQRFYEELGMMIKEGHYSKDYHFSKFIFNDGFVADFGENALKTDSYMRDTLKKVARRYALISPMLPNWPNPFIKFAGARAEFIFGYDKEIMGRNIEEAVFTELRILLETFVHYTWVRSDQTFIFADLQGAWSRDKQVFILADPQLHTSTNNGNNLAPIASWDSKMDGIASYFASHECDSFCDYLNLSEVRFKDKPAKQSAGLKNILNDVNRSPKARGT